MGNTATTKKGDSTESGKQAQALNCLNIKTCLVIKIITDEANEKRVFLCKGSLQKNCIFYDNLPKGGQVEIMTRGRKLKP